MKLVVRGAGTFASTGGRDFDPDGNVLFFIHGSGQSHLSFVLQGRFLANRGWQVLVPDFPGHGHSYGMPLTSIEDMAAWCAECMEAAGVKSAHIIGHSQGGLVALELAKSFPKKVKSMSFIATALAIPVNAALIDMSQNALPNAVAAMVDWGHGADGHRHDHTMPGQSHLLYGRALMEGNLKSALHADLAACAAYEGGVDAALTVKVPSLCILAQKDKMTPIKEGRKLAQVLKSNTLVEIEGAGHMLPSEKPFEVNTALRNFLSKLDSE